MKTDIYIATTTFGSFRFAADFTQASSPIFSLPDYDDEEDARDEPTPYQVADAQHRPERAARLLLEYYGREYWCDPSVVSTDDEGNETYDGMDKDDYLASLIVSVEAADDAG